MLVALASALASGAMGQGPLANATLEAFTIHVRVVMEFLYSENPRQDDVVAEDFLPPTVAWSSVRPRLTPALSTAKMRAGKEVAHLTYARLLVTPETKPWPFIEIAQDITSAFRVFLQHVPREKLDAAWVGESAA
jgi:hypothetical protein